MHPLLNTAVKAARRAGSIINRAALDRSALEIRAKGQNDFVTQVDRAARERHHRHPGARPIPITRSSARNPARSKARKPSTAGSSIRWTAPHNFLHGFPQYCVSIGVQHRARPCTA
jgi:myo-inositol-1(or 4)-monophosphatase